MADVRNAFQQGLLDGQRVIESRGLHLNSVMSAYKSMHPQVSDDMIEVTLILEVAMLSKLHTPFTTESVAEQIADESGAFPWNGPVGNGLTVAEYQSRFREIAEEKLFLGRKLGLIT